jgi:hypothetical protein
MKVIELIVVQIMGFVKTFSTLTFMKTRLRNRLCEYLDLVVRMIAQPFYIVDIFPSDDDITTWTEEKAKMCLASMPLGKFSLPGSHLILFI